MWYCDVCDKSNNIKNESKHINAKSHEHKDKVKVVVEEYEFFRPDKNKIDYIIEDCARCFHKKYFHTFITFILRCIYDIEMTNADLINGKTSDKKLKQFVPENGFTHKLTKKIYSRLSNTNLCYYLKLPIPIMHRQFFRNFLRTKNM